MSKAEKRVPEELAKFLEKLDNAKIGTAQFFDHVERILRSRFGVREFVRRRKPDSSRPAPPELLAELSGTDAVVSAVGD